jgi:hypothetical protein
MAFLTFNPPPQETSARPNIFKRPQEPTAMRLCRPTAQSACSSRAILQRTVAERATKEAGGEMSSEIWQAAKGLGQPTLLSQSCLALLEIVTAVSSLLLLSS